MGTAAILATALGRWADALGRCGTHPPSWAPGVLGGAWLWHTFYKQLLNERDLWFPGDGWRDSNWDSGKGRLQPLFLSVFHAHLFRARKDRETAVMTGTGRWVCQSPGSVLADTDCPIIPQSREEVPQHHSPKKCSHGTTVPGSAPNVPQP